MTNGRQRYSKPVIVRIKLDPEQAILVTCDTGIAGADVFFTAAGNNCVNSRRSTRGTVACNRAVRGRGGLGTTGHFTETQAQPS